MARNTGNSRFSALALALVAAPAVLMAQSSTTSALTGVVKDPKGKPLADAKISATSESLIGGARVVVSGSQGAFRISALPPGNYVITVEAAGYPTIKQTVQLSLGSTSNLPIQLQAQASATVEVIDRSNAVEPTPTGLGKAYSLDELESLPYKRDLSSIADLTPGVNGGIAWGGDRRNANAYLLDGMNIGDPSTGTPWIYSNPEWFQEVQVGGIGASAEFGGFTGGFINAIIKRGSNKTEGAFNSYYNTSDWQAKTSNRAPGIDRTVQKAHSSDLSLSVGGPIIKDKLWYFVSAEQIVDQQTPIGAPVPVELTNPRYLLKVTWQATPNGTLEAFGEYDKVSREHRGISNQTSIEASWRQEAPNHSYGLTWTQVFGSSAVLTLRATSFGGRDDALAYHGENPSLYIASGYNPNDPSSSTGLLYTFNNTYTVDSVYKSRGSIAATLDLFKTGLFSSTDAHAFKFGIEREQSGDEELERFPGGVSYNADSDSGGVYTDFVQVGGGYNIRARMDRLAAFAQDSWTVNNRLTLRPGLRFEQFKGRGYGGSSSIWNTSTLAPRFGLTFALTEDQRSLLKASWGRFFDGVGTAYFDRAIPGAYRPETRHTWGSNDYFTDFNHLSAIPYNPVPYTTISDVTAIDPNIKHPYMDEATLSIEQKLGDLWSMTFTAVHRQSKDLIIRVNRALREDTDPANSLDAYNLITGKVMHLFNALDDAQDYYITNSDKAKRAYQALSLSAERRYADHWSLFTSYTRAMRHGNLNRSNGYDDAFASPNSQINFDGPLPYFSDDEIKVRFSYETPWKTRLSASFTYLSGEHWTPTISTFRDNNSSRWSILAQPRGSERYPARRLLDLRASQMIVKNKGLSAEIFLDIFNALNSGSALGWNTRVNAVRTDSATATGANDIYSDYKSPTSAETPRNLRLGLRVTF
ncbi:TonB-dependent receptor [Geothrix sp. PMB-07]|uniref:TonB-dependent receptor n=1 Tax=Geothrix sp. PMB-07 TaxID=3068640 RepID=UPI002741C946|nr:TonB-dependent receptor [Geothrix sp. PMB-07]WLT30834.1 TonB-dependent receptor [Geothrix sp. PMB-07]